MRTLTALLAILTATACAPTEDTSAEDAGPYGAPLVDEEPEPEFVPMEVAMVEIDPPSVTEDDIENLTTAELRDLYFGGSGWSCCYSSICRAYRSRCADDEVLTTNGLGTICCSPSVNQCPDDGWDDVDAGT